MKPLISIPDSKNKMAFELVEIAIQRFKQSNPFIIGITGAGGAGKTTLGNNISKYYGFNNCVSIDLDDYLISRESRKNKGLTGYDPAANNLDKAKYDLECLKKGISITKPCYDHATGEVKDNEIIFPKDLIIIEGVTTLYSPLRNLSDLSFFLDALEETQIQSRIERDVNLRGYTKNEALELHESLKLPYKQFIEPTKQFASVIGNVGIDYVIRPTFITKSLR